MSPEEVIRRRAMLRETLGKFFSGSAGKELLVALEDELDFMPLNTADPYETYFRLGKFEALQIFKKLGELE